MPEFSTDWLKMVILAGAASSHDEPDSEIGIRVSSRIGTEYRISKENLIVQNEHGRMYSVFIDDRPLIFKIARDVSHNDDLKIESDVLRMLREADTDDQYNWFFPEVVEKFVSRTQGGRQVNILGFPSVVEDGSQMVPLSKIMKGGRVDLKTVVWMYGKLLKVIGYCHKNEIANGAISPSNVLVETNMHGVVLFDFTRSVVNPLHSVRNEEVKQATSMALSLVGGDPRTGELPEFLMGDPEIDLDKKGLARLERFFKETLKSGGNARNVKDRFYEIVDEIWPQRYHKFVLYLI